MKQPTGVEVHRQVLVCSALIVYLCQSTIAQPPPAPTDSSKVYRNIETFSKRSKFTRYMYGLVFKPVASVLLTKGKSQRFRLPNPDFEGKFVRSIHMVTLDPFGYSVRDTSVIPKRTLAKIGNALHVKTQYIAARNLLLFRENQPLSLLRVQESARLIRSQPYVSEALLYVTPVQQTTDSVDVNIRIVDKWSFVPSFAISKTHTTLGFHENNFAGFGHGSRNAYTWNYLNGNRAFTTNYSVPNIRNSFISAALRYDVAENDNYNKSLTVERPFYSPLARWAAGLTIAQQLHNDTIADTAAAQVRQNRKLNTEDVWAGSANEIFKGDADDGRITNAIVAARYLRMRFLQRPDELHDSVHRYSNEDFWLSAIGISTLKYLQDDYIFNFGVIEDVPVGRVYGITGGFQRREGADRLYLGARISISDYTDWGYVGSTFEYGTFFRDASLQQGTFVAGANYISNLYKIGNWRIRQFMKPQVTWGMNRFSYDSLTMNDGKGINGFNSSLQGTRKVVLTIQTQSYAPWNVWGFRFGPLLMCSLGILGTTSSGFSNSRVYSQFGVGTLIQNGYLVLSDFQMTVAYYPSIPGSGYNIVKFNSFMTADFGFGDLNFGKPRIVAFE